MTTIPFADRLLDLLPSVYRERDTQGDLAAFLGVFGPTLDEIEEFVKRMPSFWDADLCDARFLPLLAAAVGASFDPKRDADLQRRTVREAVESYREKATLPAMRRSLERTGWHGRIEETFRQTLRLNRRAALNRQRLSGEMYSLGTYRVVSETNNAGIREALAPHHPAGTRRFITYLDSDTFVQAGPRAAANLFLITQWPIPEGGP